MSEELIKYLTMKIRAVFKVFHIENQLPHALF